MFHYNQRAKIARPGTVAVNQLPDCVFDFAIESEKEPGVLFLGDWLESEGEVSVWKDKSGGIGFSAVFDPSDYGDGTAIVVWSRWSTPQRFFPEAYEELRYFVPTEFLLEKKNETH